MTQAEAGRAGSNARRALAASAAALMALAACGSEAGEASLEPTKPTTSYVGPPITAKSPTFHMSFDLDHPGAQLKVLEVTALTSPNVAYLGAVTIWPRDLSDAEGVGGGPGFPPPDVKGHHALDEVISPAETSFIPTRLGYDGPASVAVSVGFRLNGTDVGAVNGVRLVYEVDGKRMVELQRVALIACLKPRECDGPGFLEDPNFVNNTLRRYALLPEGS